MVGRIHAIHTTCIHSIHPQVLQRDILHPIHTRIHQFLGPPMPNSKRVRLQKVLIRPAQSLAPALVETCLFFGLMGKLPEIMGIVGVWSGGIIG